MPTMQIGAAVAKSIQPAVLFHRLHAISVASASGEVTTPSRYLPKAPARHSANGQRCACRLAVAAERQCSKRWGKQCVAKSVFSYLAASPQWELSFDNIVYILKCDTKVPSSRELLDPTNHLINVVSWQLQ